MAALPCFALYLIQTLVKYSHQRGGEADSKLSTCLSAAETPKAMPAAASKAMPAATSKAMPAAASKAMPAAASKAKPAAPEVPRQSHPSVIEADAA